MPVDLLRQPVDLLQQEEQPGVLDYVGAIPQTLANMATGTAGMAASGLAGVWDLISGGDLETATKRINEVSKAWADTLHIGLSKSGQDIESWIGEKRAVS